MTLDMTGKLDQMLAEINEDNGFGVLLVAQTDNVPNTLQFIVATTEAREGETVLRDKSQYLVRAITVEEHRVSMGIFQQAEVFDQEQHPLLYQYNSEPVGLFFRGEVANPDRLMLDMFQTYSRVFQDWRYVPDYLNTSKPLYDLFTGGGDLVGQMPRPLAERLEPVFHRQKAETKIIPDKPHQEQPPMKALVLDDSYIVAMDFSVETIGQPS